jgi:hypothetical protein
MNDQQLLEALRGVLESESGLIDDVIRLGLESYCWRGIDHELVTLLVESSEPAVAMRSSTEGRHFTFSTESTSVDVAVMPTDDHCILVGWVDPVNELDVSVFASTGEVIATAPIDDRGRFRIVLKHRGPIRLEFAHQPVVSTDWFSTI